MHRLMFICLALLISVSALAAVVPGQINYQGFLTAPDGSPLDTVVFMFFRIYPDSVGGLASWSEVHYSVPVINGLFTAHLGQSTPVANIFSRDSLWLGVTVGANSEMTPRTRFLAVPYSYRVGTVDYATGGSILSQVFISDKANIGIGNTNAGTRAFVVGENNVASGHYSAVGGGRYNQASDSAATIAGGTINGAGAPYSAIGGGTMNSVGGFYGTIGGGKYNSVFGQSGTVAGGEQNYAMGDYSFVGGGLTDTAEAIYAVVAGGQQNVASGMSSVVGGGGFNHARGMLSVIGGGGGYMIEDSNSASGQWATVAGGRANNAGGDYSFVAGRRAKASYAGCLVWGDATDSDITTTADNQIRMRAAGGTIIYSDAAMNTGVTLSAGGGSWNSVSDSALKRNIRRVDTRDVLDRVSRLPIKQWSYKSQDPSVEHIGPMAQDFWSAFHVGEDSLGISTIDPDGIALAAIQELHHQNQELQKELTALQARLQTLEAAQQQSLNERSNHE